MHTLTIQEQNAVNGGAFNDTFIAFMPLIVITGKGLLLCAEKNISYSAILPTVWVVGIFCAAGAIIGNTAYNDYVMGSMLGGITGMLVTTHFGIDNLE